MIGIGNCEPEWCVTAYVEGKEKEITHPVIGDTSHALSRAFGVLKEDQGIAYRATVVIDDGGLVRAVGVNDLSVGRNPGEVLRVAGRIFSGVGDVLSRIGLILLLTVFILFEWGMVKGPSGITNPSRDYSECP